MMPDPYTLEITAAYLERERTTTAERDRLLHQARRRRSENMPNRPALRSSWDVRTVVSLLPRLVRLVGGVAGKRRAATTDPGLRV